MIERVEKGCNPVMQSQLATKRESGVNDGQVSKRYERIGRSGLFH